MCRANCEATTPTFSDLRRSAGKIRGRAKAGSASGLLRVTSARSINGEILPCKLIAVYTPNGVVHTIFSPICRPKEWFPHWSKPIRHLFSPGGYDDPTTLVPVLSSDDR